MSKSLSTQTLLDFIEQIPKEEQNTFLVDFCRAIQKRKDEIITMNGFNPFPDSYNMNHVPSGANPLKYLVIEKIGKTLLGEDFHSILSSQSSSIHQDLDQNSTEAALRRVEELKYKYTPEQIEKMRRLRTEVEQFLATFMSKKTDEERDDVLRSYRIIKFPGKRRYKGEGKTPVEFIKNEGHGYKQWIDTGVIFKAEVRKIDKGLTSAIRDFTSGTPEEDPLMTEDQYTELVAAGIFGDEIRQEIAITNIQSRNVNNKRFSLYKKNHHQSTKY